MLDKVLEEQERWLKISSKERWTEIEIDESKAYFERFIMKINKFDQENAGKDFIDINSIK
ncbi:hypothetical protein [uncultured Chryseobacterium sp.]|uniref:hypothetical protein n=1 Tax=uncultured Chryseobacterium sp. TaxID=259322 RepID=UPI0025F127F4|nr:hypothetical protein [uncultured Chryseobacterium sp.]